MAAVRAEVDRANGWAPGKLTPPSSATKWMTRFPSRFFALLFLAGCTSSSGSPSVSIAQPDIAAAYIPLRDGNRLAHAEGAAMSIMPGIAVTNGHNRNLVPSERVIGEARDYDLLFFRDPRTTQVAMAEPELGGAVEAY